MFNLKPSIFILNYMDIREFYKSNQQNQSNTNNHANNNFNSNNTNKNDFSEYQDTINKYKDLSQEQLYSELLNQASSLKSQGKLDTQMLNQISSTLGPMLNSQQQQLLNSVIEKLKW